MKLCVVGTGYVGLVAGAGFADMGNDVVCVDVDSGKVEKLSRGEIPIFEPGLEDLVERNLREGRLRFTTQLKQAAADVDFAFIAVGTPSTNGGGADISQVLTVAEQLARAITRYTVIVTKSTVPVGTCDRVAEVVAKTTHVPFAVAANPEFLKEGDAVADFLKPDRILIGTEDPQARAMLADLYAPFIRTQDRMLWMAPKAAELAKYTANAMLALRISFMNDVALLCEKLSIDVDHVRRGVGSDSRIGPKFLFPGVGYGGSCLPKDLRALIATAQEAGHRLTLVEATEAINERQKTVIAEQIFARLGKSLTGRTIAVWGLAFKPQTDDTREAPAFALIERLLAAGAKVQAFDPAAGAVESARARFGEQVRWAPSNYAAAEGADALAVVTEWREFRRPDFGRLRELLKSPPTLFDGRNIWDAPSLRSMGFRYYGIGRQ